MHEAAAIVLANSDWAEDTFHLPVDVLALLEGIPYEPVHRPTPPDQLAALAGRYEEESWSEYGLGAVEVTSESGRLVLHGPMGSAPLEPATPMMALHDEGDLPREGAHTDVFKTVMGPVQSLDIMRWRFVRDHAGVPVALHELYGQAGGAPLYGVSPTE